MGLRLLLACPGLLWRLPRADLAADRRRRWKTSTWIASAWCCLHQNLAKSSLILVHLGDILTLLWGSSSTEQLGVSKDLRCKCRCRAASWRPRERAAVAMWVKLLMQFKTQAYLHLQPLRPCEPSSGLSSVLWLPQPPPHHRPCSFCPSMQPLRPVSPPWLPSQPPTHAHFCQHALQSN